MTTIERKDGITTFLVDDGRITVNLDFQRYFSNTSMTESAKKQKKLLKFFQEWEVPEEEIDDLFDEAMENLPIADRLKDNQKEWLRITKRTKPEDKMASRLSRLAYHIIHEDAIVASDDERSLIIEYYPKDMPEMDEKDDEGKLAKFHDNVLDSPWKNLGSMTKEQLNIEILSSDSRYMTLFDSKVNRKTMKKGLKYIKDKATFQTDGKSLMSIQIDGDTVLYLGRVAE